MKTSAILLFTPLILLVAKANPISNPEQDIFCKERSNGNYANPNSDCETFITCAHGTTWVMKCPLDLKYDENKDQCDYPENVVCSSSSSKMLHDSVSRSDQSVSMHLVGELFKKILHFSNFRVYNTFIKKLFSSEEAIILGDPVHGADG